MTEISIETGNDCMVAAMGNQLRIFSPRSTYTKEEALRHAAWLVVMAEGMEGDCPSFEAIKSAVANT